MNTKFIYIPMALLLASCSNVMDQSTRSIESVGVALRSVPGTITNVREVKIRTQGHPNAGTAAGMGVGAGIGALAAGSGNRMAGLGVGGAIGALGGMLAGKMARNEKGWEYTVKCDTGEIYIITQGRDVKFAVGDRVLLAIASDGTPGGLRPYND